MCKKLIISLVAIILLVGCNSTTTTNQGTERVQETTIQATTEVATEVVQETEVKPIENGLLGGKYKIELGEGKKVRSEYEEVEVLEVTYTFTNNSEEEARADVALSVRAYQDGVQMDEVFDSDITGDNMNKYIKPGTTIECKALFKLTSSSDVEVQIREYLGEDKVIKIYTLE